MKNQIKINNEFTYETETYNWTLYQWKDGKDKDGNPKRTHTRTYYAKLSQMLEAVMDKSLKHCDSFTEVKETIEKLGEFLKEIRK